MTTEQGMVALLHFKFCSGQMGWEQEDPLEGNLQVTHASHLTRLRQ